MHEVANSFTKIHQYVTWLRDKSIRLDTPELMNQAKNVLTAAYPVNAEASSCSSNNIDRYARGLRSLLTCENLPQRFSVTNGVDVPCYFYGDHVDGRFFIGNKWYWMPGVVINKLDIHAAKGYEVFWLGLPPRKSGDSKNPTFVSVHSLRSHVEEGSVAAGDTIEWLDVDKIRTEYTSERRAAAVAAEAKAAEAKAAETSKGAAAAAALEQKSSNSDLVNPSHSGLKRSRRSSKISHSTDLSDDAPSPSASKKKKTRHSPNAAPSRSDKSRALCPAQTTAVQAPSLSLYKKQFEVCDSVSYAISCLESLDQGDVEHPSVFQQLTVRIRDMAQSLAAMYHNPNYTQMVTQTLQELATYGGPELPQLPHSKVFLELLQKYGFCVTPRMFSKSEILCIAIAMLDTRHHFTRIVQKTGKETGFRGMAFLDPRVQRVLLKRLQRYGFAYPRFHPEFLNNFSSVVINGGGSWLQSSNWEFNVQSRFVMDCSVLPFAIALSDSPGVLEANGLYVATRTRRKGKPVYVQVSLIEFNGGNTRQKKDINFTAFKKCLKKDVVESVKAHALDSEGDRPEPCSPRVLCSTGDTSWGIQLLPGFDTDMYVLQFQWNEHTNANASGATCFQRTRFTGLAPETCMQSCNISITIVAPRADTVIAPEKTNELHYFSFGTTKYAERDADGDCLEVPEAMGPQAWHGDGPGVYDAAVYDDCGNLKPDAPSCGERKKRKVYMSPVSKRGSQHVSEAAHLSANSWCPFVPRLLKPFLPEHNDILSESWSALGSVFTGTYIETLSKPRDQGQRKDLDNIAALRVPVPLGCMAPFTFFWKHRGKGDKESHKPVKGVPIHARPHDYNYCSDPRKLPTIDFEATLEFHSTCSNAAAPSDPCSQLQVLECLQTFNRSSVGHDEQLPPYHDFFCDQESLDEYIQRAHTEQCRIKAGNELACDVVEARDWKIVLCSTGGQKIVRVHGQGLSDDGIVCQAADFDSDIPLFFGCDGQKYKLRDNGSAELQGGPSIFSFVELKQLLEAATKNMVANWCSATLHHLLCLLDTHVLPTATLRINEHNVLVAEEGATCHQLLPFYTMVGTLDQSKLMRLYTIRGVGTRIIVPDPYTVLKDWSFVALEVRVKGKLGFRCTGRRGRSDSEPWNTTEIAGIESEGVVLTLNGTPYRLAGNSDLDKYADKSIRDAMKKFPKEGSWFATGPEFIHGVFEELSACFLNPRVPIAPKANTSSERSPTPVARDPEDSLEIYSASSSYPVSQSLGEMLTFFCAFNIPMIAEEEIHQRFTSFTGFCGTEVEIFQDTKKPGTCIIRGRFEDLASAELCRDALNGRAFSPQHDVGAVRLCIKQITKEQLMQERQNAQKITSSTQ
jgi:hypothetical protein